LHLAYDFRLGKFAKSLLLRFCERREPVVSSRGASRDGRHEKLSSKIVPIFPAKSAMLDKSLRLQKVGAHVGSTSTPATKRWTRARHQLHFDSGIFIQPFPREMLDRSRYAPTARAAGRSFYSE